jgi:hypothetical protein
VDGTCSFLFNNIQADIEAFFLDRLDRHIDNLTAAGALLESKEEVVTVIALMACLTNYQAEQPSIVKGMLKAGLATRMEALFKLCCKFAPGSVD